METNSKYEMALDYFSKILVIKEMIRTGKKELDSLEYDSLAIVLNNITKIAEGTSADEMVFMSDIPEDEIKDNIRRHEVFNATKVSQSFMIGLWEDFLESGDYSAIKDEYDKLMKDL